MYYFNGLFVIIVSLSGAAKANNPGAAPSILMNDGHLIPALGLGTWLGYDEQGKRVQTTGDEVLKVYKFAIDAGYRHIDTAPYYDTEEVVGRAINQKISDGTVAREDIFITTKLWNDQHAEKAVVPTLKRSLQNLNLDYVDLYLIHWPTGIHANGSFDSIDYVETWRGMVEARNLGLTNSIGLSNFNISMVDRLISMSAVKPAVLQVEVNLNLQQSDLLAWCRSQNILVAGYTPFGAMFGTRRRIPFPPPPPPRANDSRLLAIAERHNKTVTQVVLRYLAESGVIPLPKSSNRVRIVENINIFDFSLNPEDKMVLKSFDINYRSILGEKWKDSIYYPFEKLPILYNVL